MKKITIFLASSNELLTERNQIELQVSRKSNFLKEQKKDINLEIVRWETLLQSFHGDRVQDFFNNKIADCEVLIAVFYTKVGNFTKEEFEVAYKNFKKNKNPKYIFAYFYEPELCLSELGEDYLKIIELKKYIKNEKQIYISVKSKDELLHSISQQLDIIIYEKSSEAIKDPYNKDIILTQLKAQLELIEHSIEVQKKLYGITKIDAKLITEKARIEEEIKRM